MGASVVVIGGTSGLGFELAKTYRMRGADVAITGRDEERALRWRPRSGDGVRSIVLDLGRTGVDRRRPARDQECRPTRARCRRSRPELRRRLRRRPSDSARHAQARRLHGGRPSVRGPVPAGRVDSPRSAGSRRTGRIPARPRSDVNGAVSTMIRTMALELAPVRVNAIHPGIVADTPFWSGKEEHCENALPDADGPERHDVRHRRRVDLPSREPGRERRQPRRRRRLDGAASRPPDAARGHRAHAGVRVKQRWLRARGADRRLDGLGAHGAWPVSPPGRPYRATRPLVRGASTSTPRCRSTRLRRRSRSARISSSSVASASPPAATSTPRPAS